VTARDETTVNVLSWLQSWYASRCDGEWEESYGVAIDTLDNPGWTVRIDLNATPLDGSSYPRQETHRSEDDWVVTWIADHQFNAVCGPLNLAEALGRFRQWANSG
jgi:Immunity protein 53